MDEHLASRLRPTTWTIPMLHALDADEYDYQEFKGSRLLEEDGQIAPTFIRDISRQVSAFANGAGGHIFVGIDDGGRVDEGVRCDLKPGGTRSWLEDVLPATVDPPLQRFNVFEVRDPEGRTRLRPGSAVYVIDIPASEDAPHQARDYRYYLRIAGKSRPMGSVHIQDVLHRTRLPRVGIARVDPHGPVEHFADDPRGPKALVRFQTVLSNAGVRLAHHVGAELILPRPLVNRQVRELMLSQSGVSLTQRPGELLFFRYHPIPLFPGQDIFFQHFWVAIHKTNLEHYRSGIAVRWRVFADDAPPTDGEAVLRQFTVVRRTVADLEAAGSADDRTPG